MENQTKKAENNEIIEADNKKYCTACGAKLHEESAMCPSCGTMQEATVPVTEEKGINVFKKNYQQNKRTQKTFDYLRQCTFSNNRNHCYCFRNIVSFKP